MILFDKVREKAEGLRRMGERAVDEAGRAGVPAYYMDPAYGEDIIREFPNGRRERVHGGPNGTATPIALRR